MARFLEKKNGSIGQAPGSLVFIGTKKIDQPIVRVIDYDSATLQEMELFHAMLLQAQRLAVNQINSNSE